MSRSLVTAEKITPPKELEVLFDDPPLVGNERREDQERSSRAPWKFISALGPTMRRSDLTFPDKVSDVVLVATFHDQGDDADDPAGDGGTEQSVLRDDDVRDLVPPVHDGNEGHYHHDPNEARQQGLKTRGCSWATYSAKPGFSAGYDREMTGSRLLGRRGHQFTPSLE